MIRELQGAWLIKHAVLQDRMQWCFRAPALFKVKYVEQLKKDILFASRMVVMHGMTKS
jgi:hypothetical protein